MNRYLLPTLIDRADQVFCLSAFGAFLFTFNWFCLGICFGSGLASADDGYLALVAKAFAVGMGYGAPVSSAIFSPFEPGVGSGPALILPLSLLTALFGAHYWLPGLTSLVIFNAQLLIAVTIFARQVGWAAASGFAFAALLVVCSATTKYWLFGVYLGEPVALGFILVGIALLVQQPTLYSSTALAGAALSLAFLTKQISAFPIVGLLSAWIVILAHQHKLSTVLRHAALILAVAAILPCLFELWKIAALGWNGYTDLLARARSVTSVYALGAGDLTERTEQFFSTLKDWYVPDIRISIIVLLTVIVAASVATPSLAFSIIAVIFVNAAMFHFLYIWLFSTLWPRYFWVGVVLSCFALSLPVAFVKPRWRIGIVAISAVLALMTSHAGTLFVRFPWTIAGPVQTEQAETVSFIEKRHLPFAAETWGSFFDIVYLIKQPLVWVQDAQLEDIKPESFTAIIHERFTSKKSRFYQSVTSACERATPKSKIYHIYLCGERFWAIPR